MNEYGLDARYFKEKLGQLVRDADNYTPAEMALALGRLQAVAEPSKAVAVARPKKADIDAAFEEFWQAGMRKMKKKASRVAFERAIPADYSPEGFAIMLREDICDRLRIGQYGFEATHPTSYLNGELWTDEIKAPQQDVLTPLLDCFGAVATAEADDTLAFMRGITGNAKKTSSEVQGLLTLEHDPATVTGW